MNSFFSFPIFLLCLCKSNVFLCSHYMLLDSVLFFCSVLFLVKFIISSVKFNFSNELDKLFFRLSFGIVFFSLYLCFSSCSSLVFLFWLEMCVFFMIFLILVFSKELDKLSSSFFMFFLNILGSIPFMGFCSFFSYSFENLHWSSFFWSSCLSMTIAIFMLLILIFKLPILFSHFWLTKAHVAASGPLSMILASLMLKLGTMGMLKFNYFVFFSSHKIMSFLMSFSLFSCLFFNTLMIFSFDLKFLVACSSVLHMSFLVPGSLSNSSVGCFGSLFMTVGHGFSSLILFFLLTLTYEFSMSRSSDVSKCQESYSKFYSKWIFIYSFVNLGIPPFLSFFSELFLFSFFSGNSWLSALFFGLAMLSSIFFTVFFVLKILFGKKNELSELKEIYYFSSYLKFCTFLMIFFSLFLF